MAAMMMRKRATGAEKAEGGLWVREGFARSPECEHPLVSVVTVCLNDAEHLEETIESVLGQSYCDVEHIIVDGGSTDGTLDILKRYDDRLSYWSSEPDDGIYHAMNRGVSLATGELVGTLNCGDRYFPYTVEEVAGASLEHPEAQVFFGPMYVIAEDGGFLRVWPGSSADIERRFEMNHPTCFVRRAVYDDYSYRTRFKLLADYDLMLRLHLEGMSFHRLELPLASFRAGGASSAYYRGRAESYDVRWDNDLLGAWEYVYKRSALVFKAPAVRARGFVARTCFKEIATLEEERGYLLGDNLAMKDEIEIASAHIAGLEKEIEARDAEIERLSRELTEREAAVHAAHDAEPSGTGEAPFSTAGYERREGTGRPPSTFRMLKKLLGR